MATLMDDCVISGGNEKVWDDSGVGPPGPSTGGVSCSGRLIKLTAGTNAIGFLSIHFHWVCQASIVRVDY